MSTPTLKRLRLGFATLLCFILCFSSFPAQALATTPSSMSQTTGATALSSRNLNLEDAYSPVISRALSFSGEFAECINPGGYQMSPYYTLFDLTGDSIPELLVYHGSSQQTLRWYVFSAQGGSAAYLGKIEGFFLYDLYSVEDRLYANTWHANAGSILSLSYSGGKFQTSVVSGQTSDNQYLANYLKSIGATGLKKPLASDLSLLRTVSKAYSKYGEVLDQYLDVLDAIERNPSSLSSEEFAEKHPYVNITPFREGIESVGYACMDLNGDTVPELLLGGKSEYGYERADFLSHIVSYSQSSLRDAIVGTCYRSWSYLSNKGDIVTRGSSGAYDGEIEAYALSSSGNLKQTQSIRWHQKNMTSTTELELTRTTGSSSSTSVIAVNDLGGYIDSFMSGFSLRTDIPWMPIEESGVASSDEMTMYRLYNPNTGEHFYTSSTAERDNLSRVGWCYEGVGWVAPTSGDPVYRLYNPNAPGGDHHYTVGKEERDHLVSLGWHYEGIGWYSGGTVKVYRQYNPNAASGTHNYTTGVEENDTLVSLGWRYEGVGWYALRAK